MIAFIRMLLILYKPRDTILGSIHIRSLVPRSHPRGRKRVLVTLGNIFGPVDDPWRNLRVPIRS